MIDGMKHLCVTHEKWQSWEKKPGDDTPDKREAQMQKFHTGKPKAKKKRNASAKSKGPVISKNGKLKIPKMPKVSEKKGQRGKKGSRTKPRTY